MSKTVKAPKPPKAPKTLTPKKPKTNKGWQHSKISTHGVIPTKPSSSSAAEKLEPAEANKDGEDNEK
jgi:hypothetical protein